MRSLLKDKNSKSWSLGRIAFWVTFIIIIAWWILIGVAVFYGKAPADIPSSLFNVFASLLLYNTADKGKTVLDKMIDNKGAVNDKEQNNKQELLKG